MTHEKKLDTIVDVEIVRKIRAVGNEFDVDKGGLFDARMGCVNIWCSPDDKPSCWDIPIIRGGLNHPRSFIGTLTWEWGEKYEATLSLCVNAYELAEVRKITEDEWKAIMDWAEEKAWFLIRMAKIHPKAVGHKCPFCNFVLPMDRSLTDLLTHIEEHGQVEGIVVGKEQSVLVNGRSYRLELDEE